MRSEIKGSDEMSDESHSNIRIIVYPTTTSNPPPLKELLQSVGYYFTKCPRRAQNDNWLR